jgi:hypothetical protein
MQITFRQSIFLFLLSPPPPSSSSSLSFALIRFMLQLIAKEIFCCCFEIFLSLRKLFSPSLESHFFFSNGAMSLHGTYAILWSTSATRKRSTAKAFYVGGKRPHLELNTLFLSSSFSKVLSEREKTSFFGCTTTGLGYPTTVILRLFRNSGMDWSEMKGLGERRELMGNGTVG